MQRTHRSSPSRLAFEVQPANPDLAIQSGPVLVGAAGEKELAAPVDAPRKNPRPGKRPLRMVRRDNQVAAAVSLHEHDFLHSWVAV